ncbi:unnamed protein product [Notodromas monacha]|uniref:Protein HTATIP2 n=1 Tax=Notodromas monacha TaxID=399045 RepID=A0A7R9GEN2_9CRUS|nr:unnamed protein product [Notodromas monacha]CAG0919914.1 unnamed protein product [Notodromas monacha]
MESDEGKLKAFILGATGEVGKALVHEVLNNENFASVVLIGRRKMDVASVNSQKLEQRVVDFDHLQSQSSAFSNFDVGFCCLGTTRAKAGAEGFVKVDHDYVVDSAKQAKEGGCKHFVLLTAVGANENSMFLYNKTKGLAEEHVKNLGFERFSIFRPGLLLCDRVESRPLEKIAQRFSKLVDFGKWYSVPVESVAKAMVISALKPQTNPVEIFSHADIVKLASS